MSAPVIGFLILLVFVANPINGLNTRKLDDTTVTGPPDTEIKCGSCPCNSPCGQSPPPPSPPPPQIYPSPPPPSPKKPPTPSLNCPPPPSTPSTPSSQYIYVTGPPGNLYPVDPYFSNTCRSLVVALPLLVGSALVGLFAFW